MSLMPDGDVSSLCAKVGVELALQFGEATHSLPPYLYLNRSKLIEGKRSQDVFTRIHLRSGLIFGPYVGIVRPTRHGKYSWKVKPSILLLVITFFPDLLPLKRQKDVH